MSIELNRDDSFKKFSVHLNSSESKEEAETTINDFKNYLKDSLKFVIIEEFTPLISKIINELILPNQDDIKKSFSPELGGILVKIKDIESEISSLNGNPEVNTSSPIEELKKSLSSFREKINSSIKNALLDKFDPLILEKKTEEEKHNIIKDIIPDLSLEPVKSVSPPECDRNNEYGLSIKVLQSYDSFVEKSKLLRLEKELNREKIHSKFKTVNIDSNKEKEIKNNNFRRKTRGNKKEMRRKR